MNKFSALDITVAVVVCVVVIFLIWLIF